ncbi:hypothetical protein RhiirA4_449206 [Rhizophagus irregularis]|uniref:CR-type domain-containing protein n=1 Tax=Rhizophagus irregularis TaxID=588596 RepID=A0A2I1HH14_9GLOM|nr:hypothetical protein RhiirA4_449206 [Rhizophagus irregularis]
MAIAEPIEVEVGKEGAVKICSNCDGSGVIVLLRTFGPMVQEFQQPCDTCGGEGEIIKEKDRTYKNRRPKINKFDRTCADVVAPQEEIDETVSREAEEEKMQQREEQRKKNFIHSIVNIFKSLY